MVTVSVVPSDPAYGTVSGGGTVPCYTSTTLLATASEGYRFLRWKVGNHSNPFTFSPNNDYTDTAFFTPIYGDTLGYCFAGLDGLWGEYNGVPPEWGIRLPARSVPHHRQLNAVQFYGVSNASYNINVFMGNNFDRLIFSSTQNTTSFGWYTIPLTTPVPLVDSLPLWITISCRSYTNPATYSSYSGNPDGTWYKRAGTTWEHLEGRNEYKSWMIQAILGELDQVTLTVEASHADRGTVDGGGAYYPGDTAILTATPAAGYRFAGWSTGDFDNPLHLRVTTSETLIATFLPAVGIEEAEDSKFKIDLSGLTLTVDNPCALPMVLFDMQGRQLLMAQSPRTTVTLPAAGIYMLRVGDSMRKIVAIN